MKTIALIILALTFPAFAVKRHRQTTLYSGARNKGQMFEEEKIMPLLQVLFL
jgi:hypothetical protein